MSRATDRLMDAGCLHDFSPEQSVRASIKQKSRGFVCTIKLWQERSRQRRELRVLADNADLLKDVGLSGYDVQHEGYKPFWRK